MSGRGTTLKRYALAKTAHEAEDTLTALLIYHNNTMLMLAVNERRPHLLQSKDAGHSQKFGSASADDRTEEREQTGRYGVPSDEVVI